MDIVFFGGWQHVKTSTACTDPHPVSSPLSRCNNSFMRPAGSLAWSSVLSDQWFHINHPIISWAQQRGCATQPPNPITLGGVCWGCSDWITQGWVATVLTCSFDLVMMLIFSIWPRACVLLSVSPSVEVVHRLSSTPALMASGDGGKSQPSTIGLPGANLLMPPLPVLYPNPLFTGLSFWCCYFRPRQWSTFSPSVL